MKLNAAMLTRCLVVAVSVAQPVASQTLPEHLERQLVQVPIDRDGSVLRFTEVDRPLADNVVGFVRTGRTRTEAFFGRPFPRPLRVTMVPSREAFTAVLRTEWGVSESACWMVATGVADFLVLLSPRAWAAQACEHDADDGEHVQDIMTHELVHVYHGQHNPSGDFSFDDAEKMAWLLEGLAVYASGQLNRSRLATAAEALEAGAFPTELAAVWSGQYRYGLAGSLVAYVDDRFGRDVVRRLLGATSQQAVLEVLGLAEQDLLDRWRQAVARTK